MGRWQREALTEAGNSATSLPLHHPFGWPPSPSLRDREDRQRPLPTPRRTCPSQESSIPRQPPRGEPARQQREIFGRIGPLGAVVLGIERSEEHTSELQSLMRISYAVFCLKKKQTASIIYRIAKTLSRTT